MSHITTGYLAWTNFTLNVKPPNKVQIRIRGKALGSCKVIRIRTEYRKKFMEALPLKVCDWKIDAEATIINNASICDKEKVSYLLACLQTPRDAVLISYLLTCISPPSLYTHVIISLSSSLCENVLAREEILAGSIRAVAKVPTTHFAQLLLPFSLPAIPTTVNQRFLP